MEKHYFDISIPISSHLPIWPGDPNVVLRQVSSIKKGAESNVSLLRMSVHTGTHIDAPKHFIDNGKTIDQLPLDKLIGPALIMGFGQDVSVISEEVLERHPAYDLLYRSKKVLFKTRNSEFWCKENKEFQTDYVGLDASAAQLLADLDLDLVGVDYLSIAPYTDTETPHIVLLGKGIVLLEGINLSEVPEGTYRLYCLPLLVKGCEGSPARVILEK